MKHRTLAPSWIPVCALLLAVNGCSGDSEKTPPAVPTVASTTPVAGATGVAANATITATFSEAMDPATIDASTFTVKDPAGHAVSGTVTSSGATATFTATLTPLVTYTATITTGAKSAAGQALASNHSWSFTVATTPTPLLSRATLKAWIDVGLVNGTGSERVVVLDVGSSSYATAHIPGAQSMSPGDATAPLYQNRQEGPAVDVNMVPEGAKMDAIVHKYGIDDRTTVVLTGPSSGSSLMTVTRVYWTFRYWGFAKDKLKLLDGLDGGWTTAGYATSTDVPSITPSTHSVKSNASLRDDLRASLTEMMAVASGSVSNAVIVDARSTVAPASYAGDPASTQGVFGPIPPNPKDYVVFEGHMKNAKSLDYTTLYDGTTFEFKSRSALETSFNSVGLDSTKTKTAYVHCRTGVIAAVPFFALDAILDWPVANYDGSWSQWGQLSASSENGGQLAAGSWWQTDVPALSDLVVYNHSNGTANQYVELLALNGASCTAWLAPATNAIAYFPTGCDDTVNGGPGFTGPDSSLPLAQGNQIEEADALYMTQ